MGGREDLEIIERRKTVNHVKYWIVVDVAWRTLEKEITTTKRQDSHRFNNGGSHGFQLELDWLISKPNSIAKDAVQFRISNSPSALVCIF